MPEDIQRTIDILQDENTRIAANTAAIKQKIVDQHEKHTAKVHEVSKYKHLMDSHKTRNEELNDKYDNLSNVAKAASDAREIFKITAAAAITSDAAHILANSLIDKVQAGMSVEDAISSIKTDKAYGSLVRGVQSRGGSAIGGTAGYALTSVNRAQFAAMSESAKQAWCDAGKQITDE